MERPRYQCLSVPSTPAVPRKDNCVAKIDLKWLTGRRAPFESQHHERNPFPLTRHTDCPMADAPHPQLSSWSPGINLQRRAQLTMTPSAMLIVSRLEGGAKPVRLSVCQLFDGEGRGSLEKKRALKPPLDCSIGARRYDEPSVGLHFI